MVTSVVDGAPDMTDPGKAIDSESWDFALKLYAEPGIADSCLSLQAECSVDVMMLLAAAFAAVRRGVVLTPFDIADMDAACRPWREQIVLPLRALRATLKTGPAPAPSERTEKLRSSIKAAELSAERLQNEVLAHWLAKKPPGSGAADHAEIVAVLHALVSFASRGHRGAQLDVQRPAIATIVDAALRLSA
jgi:uncharacterized protein (TIGR02444 family)